jgi:tetratricopeptide (TPR) repeat protein
VLALLAARTQQFEVAEQFYRDCLTAGPAPDEPSLYSGLLAVLWAMKQYDGIVQVCRDGLAQGHATNRVLFHNHLARALVLGGKVEEALAEADQAVQLSSAENRVHFRLLRIEILRLADRNESALSECKALLHDTSDLKDVRDIHYALSGVYSALDDQALAERELRLILEAQPDDPPANNDLGYMLADQNKNLEEAERLIRHALAMDGADTTPSPEADQPNAAYIDSLGWVLYRRGQFAAACTELERAVKLPDGAGDPVVWAHLGEVYCHMNQLSRARQVWQRAIRLYEIDKRRKRGPEYRELKQKLHKLELEVKR